MKKIILFALIFVILLSGLFLYEYGKFHDGKLHVIFCDVGLGDAILIRTPSDKYILVDGGPDQKVLACLSQYMPFWQRTIDLVFLTHPHTDHFMGMFYVAERYIIKSFNTERLTNKSSDFQEFMKEIKEKKVPLRYVSAGDRWKVQNGKSIDNEVVLSIQSPTTEFLKRTSPNGEIGEKKEFASLTTLISYGSFTALLTGDSQVNALLEATNAIGEELDVLQAPHHGSATGLTRAFLKKQHPRITVISVGAKNRYGHPNKNVLTSLMEEKIPFLRTDQRGDIEIVSDGKSFEVRGKP